MCGVCGMVVGLTQPTVLINKFGKEFVFSNNNCYQRRRRWGGGGGGREGTGLPSWCKVSKFRAKFWAIFYILGDFIFFGQYCVKILGNFMSLGQVWLVKDSEHWTEKQSQCEWSKWRPYFYLFFWRSQFGQKNRLNLSEDHFFLEDTTIGRKNRLNLNEDLFFLFFFGGHHNLDWKTGSIWVKTFFFWRTTKFGQNNRLNLSEDFFSFFGGHHNLIRKNDWFVRQL